MTDDRHDTDDDVPAEPEPAEPEDGQTSVYEQRVAPEPRGDPDVSGEGYSSSSNRS
jgi:hypothetical protein